MFFINIQTPALLTAYSPEPLIGIFAAPDAIAIMRPPRPCAIILFSRGLTGEEAAVEIDRHQLAPIGEVDFMKEFVFDFARAIARMRDAGGREHDVEAAKIVDGLREHRGDL